MCAAGACGVMANAFLVGADNVGRCGTSQASHSTHSQPARLEAGFSWRAASGLAAGFGYEALPYPGRRRQTHDFRIACARWQRAGLERAVLSATMAASGANLGSMAWADAAWHVELDLPTGPSTNYPISSI